MKKDWTKEVFKSRRFWFGTAVFLLAVSLRLFYLYESSDNPTFYMPVVDSLTYDQMAQKLLENKTITREFFWQPLFYPLFLSAVYSFSNSSILLVKLIQVVLAGLTSVLVYKLGGRAFGLAAGILAGVITAVYIPLVFFECELLAPGWAAFFSVVLVLCLINSAEKIKLFGCFLLGFSGAVGIVIRPVFVPFFAAGCIWLVVVWLKKRVGLKSFAIAAAVVAAGFLLVAVPVGILNYRVMGKASILPYSGGINFYVGNNPNYKETIMARPGLGWLQITDLPKKYGYKDRYSAQRFFIKKAAEGIIAQPMTFFKRLMYKTAQFFSSREIPRNVDIYLFRKWSVLLGGGVWKAGEFGFPFGLLLPLAVIGAVCLRRDVPVPVWLFVIFYSAAVIIVFVTSRYRIVVVPVMSVLAGGGCAVILKFLAQQRFKRLAAVAIAVVAVGFASAAAGPFYEEQIDYEPELYYGLGDSLNKHGRRDEAIEAYLQAVRLRSDYVEARHNVGLLLVDNGRVDEALEHFSSALEVRPDNSALQNDMGMALCRQGKIKEGVLHYQKAVEIDPNNFSAHSNLGTAYIRLRRFNDAFKHYLRAVEIKPDDPVLNNNLGNVFALRGRPDKAVEYYRVSLRAKPEDAETLGNCANVLAEMGKFEEAGRMYKKSLRIDANQPGICANFGMCLAEQGRNEEAIEQYKKALEIEPGHKRARKELDKLLP